MSGEAVDPARERALRALAQAIAAELWRSVVEGEQTGDNRRDRRSSRRLIKKPKPARNVARPGR